MWGYNLSSGPRVCYPVLKIASHKLNLWNTLLFVSSRGVRTDASLVPPIRQTASIFKQPVTVYKTQEGKVKTDFKHGPQEKPKQVTFKYNLKSRLEGTRIVRKPQE